MITVVELHEALTKVILYGGGDFRIDLSITASALAPLQGCCVMRDRRDNTMHVQLADVPSFQGDKDYEIVCVGDRPFSRRIEGPGAGNLLR